MLSPKRELGLPSGAQRAESLAGADAALLNSMNKVELIPSQKRRHGNGFGYVAVLNGFVYHVDYQREGAGGARVYWKCTQRGGCGARIITDKNGVVLNARNNFHSHEPFEEGNENKMVRASRTRTFNYQSNLALIREISKRRQHLFGTNDQLTAEENALIRECAWEEIRKALATQGHAKLAGKDWKLLRAHGWQQARKTAVYKKFLNMVPGAKTVPLDELDNIVLDIIGNDQLFDTESIDDETPVETPKDEADSATVSTSPSLSNEPLNPLEILQSFCVNLADENQKAATNSRNDRTANSQDGDESPKTPFDELHGGQKSATDSSEPPDSPDFQADGEQNLQRLQLAQDRLKLKQLQQRIAQEKELHELKLEVERANLRHARARATYEEERLKRFPQDAS
ncbi:hypothetical protein M3Y99_01235500 [Aphelenchoides fujianensis]|nr:hypothetical protein M3Y99_01235500 [Aphelenchoides fujianensis]